MNFQELMATHDIRTPEALAELIKAPIEPITEIFFCRVRRSLNDLSNTTFIKSISEALQCPIMTMMYAFYESMYGGYVYVMETRNIHKIGQSKDPSLRHRTLRMDYPSLVLIHTIFSNNANILEKHMHNIFTQYRLAGEWFQLPNEEIRTIQSIKSIRFKLEIKE